MKTQALQNLLMGILILALVAVAFFLVIKLAEIGVEKQEIVNCYQWQDHSERYSGFYLTQRQSEQCEHHQIEINAPVYGE